MEKRKKKNRKNENNICRVAITNLELGSGDVGDEDLGNARGQGGNGRQHANRAGTDNDSLQW